MIAQTILEFKVETTGEILTARSGLALMAEYQRGLGLGGLVTRHLPGPGSNRGYEARVFVEALVLMLQGGGRGLEDVRELAAEGGLMRLVKREEVPDAGTIGDWLRRMGDRRNGQRGLKGLDEVRTELNRRMMKRDGIREYTLDADATEICGEKAEAEYTYKGNKGYMPMVGYLYENGLCVHEEFREGNVGPQEGQTAFYVACKARMPAGTRIGRYRADSASYQAAVINMLEADGVTWAMTADQDCAVKEVIAGIGADEWRRPDARADYEVAESVHCMNQTGRAFRLVVKREVVRQMELWEERGTPYKYHVVATNWRSEEKAAAAVLAWHNQRGQAENFNKELKGGFGLEGMPCGTTAANAVFFRIGVIAYNLFIGFKRLACPTGWAAHTIATFRWRLIQVAGRIVRHAGGVVLKIAADMERLALFRAIRQRSWELRWCDG